MIHYHGLPINPQTAALAAIEGGHAFISFSDTHPIGLAIAACQSFALDNGAFTAWKTGRPVADWRPYYAWVGQILRAPGFDFAVVPDVIEGSEADNDALLAAWPFPGAGAPVWHLHESLDRLARLAAAYPRLCFGSSGRYSQPGSAPWWDRISAAMHLLCDASGAPQTKIHGLRMLDPALFQHIPLASADSTNIARNIGIDRAWRGTYTPPTKEARALILRQRIERCQSPARWRSRAPAGCDRQQDFTLNAT